jgi:photosystem II stability/assembly factor-like uncharacterized protein
MYAAPLRPLAAIAAAVLLGLACSLVSPGRGATEAPATATVPPAAPTPTELGQAATATSAPTVGVPTPTELGQAPTELAQAGEPLPELASGQPVTLTVVKLQDELHGWAIGYGTGDVAYDHLLVTADGGQSWRDVSPPEARAAEPAGRAAVAYFQDAQTAWATYFGRDIAPDSAALVWRTTDGGTTWQPSAPLDLSDVEFFATSDLHFVDGDHGWLLTHVGAGMNHDYVVLFATGDGGQTFTRVVDPFEVRDNTLQMSCLKTGLGFLNPQTGWVTGDCQAVAPGVFLQRTDDGGHTWAAVSLPAPEALPDAFERQDGGCGTYHLATFAPQTVKVAVTCLVYTDTLTLYHFLYSSTDGGATWTSASLPARECAWLDANTGWTIDPADPNDPAALRRLYQTTDGGATWQYLNTVTWTAQLNFVSPEQGWAVAQAGPTLALVHTSSGGRSWGLLAPVAAP